MSSTRSSRSRTLLAGLFALTASACITDLRVGIERADDEDAGIGPENTPDGGDDPGPCEPIECGQLPQIIETRCAGSVPEYVCERNERGKCVWVDSGECPPPEDPPCTKADCEGPLLIAPERVACSDGSEPVCDRDPATGLCGYQCAEAASCGTASGAGCASGEYCWFKVGLCGAGGPTGGQCTPLPTSCDANEAPVCGCDGNSYTNACEAARAAVNVAFAGSCADAPELCESCAGPEPDPSAQRIACEDGISQSGPTCVFSVDGSCQWQWLQCPDKRECSAAIGGPERGRCFGPEDCPPGETCEGASLCPCEAECFAPDTPGYCKSAS